MAEIDLKFMKGNRQLAKAIGNNHAPKRTKKSGAKKTVKKK